jgi:hypothetical protein
MATQSMLQQRNSLSEVEKLANNALTLLNALTSLKSTSKRIRLWFARWAATGDLSGRAGAAAGALILAVAGGLSGCASMPGSQTLSADSPIEVKREVLTKRINARWDALIAGNIDSAYAYLSEASKSAYPLEVYKAKVKPGLWRAVKIESIDCDGGTCWARMMLTYDYRTMKGVQTPFSESWIIEKGDAWFIYQPSV